MSRRSRIQVITGLAAVFLIMGGFILRWRCMAQDYARHLGQRYQHAFAELTAQLEGMDAALQKGQYATSPTMVSALCAEVYSRSAAAQMALGELPFSHIRLEQTAAFLSKAGDYAWSLSKTAHTAGVTEEARQTLSALAAVSAQLSRRVYSLQEELNSKDFSPQALSQAEQELAQQEGDEQIPAGNSFQQVEEEFPELPTLIYDGPFSQHLTDRSPAFLDGMPQLEQEEARRAAAAFLDLPLERMEPVSAGEGALPTYGFSLADRDKTLYLELTRQGGVVLELLTDRQTGPTQLVAESALAIAGDFLREHGYRHMTETYHIRQGNLLIINYAYQQGEVLCYPDFVKVTVALDTGEIHSFESQGYVMNHRERELPSSGISAQEARTALSPVLTLLSHRLALIPTSGQYEVLCYEFLCQTGNGRHILVYINAQNGEEEKILLLQEDENGTLVK